MDAAKELIQRVLAQKTRLGLHVRVLTWPKLYALPWHDIQFEAHFDGEIHIGRGTAASENLALTIAAMELVERLAIVEAKINGSNGIAAHFDRSSAAVNAERELIERDRLLNHIHSKTPFQQVAQIFSGDEARAVKILKDRGIEIEIWGLRQIGDNISRICIAFGANAPHPFGMMVGLGTSESAEAAASSAFRECLRHAVVAVEHAEEPISESEFAALKRFTPEEHHRLALDSEYAKKFRSTFCVEGFDDRTDTPFEDVEVTDVPAPEFARGLVHICRSESPQAQNLYFGPAKTSELNLKALSKFAGRPMTEAFKFFHPLS